jgi:hypothetical protein
MFIGQNFQGTIEKPLSAIDLLWQLRVDQLLFLDISIKRGDFRGFEIGNVNVNFFLSDNGELLLFGLRVRVVLVGGPSKHEFSLLMYWL